MTSARKRFNNAQNAHACTGPKTAADKARSARNALKHALNLPALADPMLAPGVEELASKIAGADAGSTTPRVGKTKLENPIVSTAASRSSIP
jgi:hypothetical protein